jgi:hypothetical protein
MTVLASDSQLHDPWYAEVAWSLEGDVVRSWDTRADANKGVLESREGSGHTLIGKGSQAGEVDSHRRFLIRQWLDGLRVFVRGTR